MKKISVILCSMLMFGCATTEQNISETAAKDSEVEAISATTNTIDTFTFDPLSKVTVVDVPTYYSRVFKDFKPYLKDVYSGAYVSSPHGYVIEDKIVTFTPWVPTASDFTVFPTAHYLLLTQITASGVVTTKYNHEQVIELLKRDYKVTEKTTPFFHYVLELSPSQQTNFEVEIIKKLSVLPSES